jgi:hypothetical protein
MLLFWVKFHHLATQKMTMQILQKNYFEKKSEITILR